MKTCKMKANKNSENRMDTLFFKVAGLHFAITSHDASELKRLLPSYAPFYVGRNVEGEKIALHVTITPNGVSPDPIGEEMGQFDCGGTNHGVYRLQEGGYKIVISSVDGHLSSAMLTNADFSECSVSLYGDYADQSFGLGNAMMIAFAFAAAYYGVVLMHASVTMNSGFGYLFLGKSGTGKSTHSMLWRKYIEGSDLLNDDNPAVRVSSSGEVIVYGTPWSGKTPCYRNMQVPVGSFLRLEQNPENVISKQSVLETFASVLSSCSTMVWDKPSYNCITQTVSHIASHVHSYYLKCRADEEAALLSYQNITKAH